MEMERVENVLTLVIFLLLIGMVVLCCWWVFGPVNLPPCM